MKIQNSIIAIAAASMMASSAFAANIQSAIDNQGVSPVANVSNVGIRVSEARSNSIQSAVAGSVDTNAVKAAASVGNRSNIQSKVDAQVNVDAVKGNDDIADRSENIAEFVRYSL